MECSIDLTSRFLACLKTVKSLISPTSSFPNRPKFSRLPVGIIDCGSGDGTPFLMKDVCHDHVRTLQHLAIGSRLYLIDLPVLLVHNLESRSSEGSLNASSTAGRGKMRTG